MWKTPIEPFGMSHIRDRRKSWRVGQLPFSYTCEPLKVRNLQQFGDIWNIVAGKSLICRTRAAVENDLLSQ